MNAYMQVGMVVRLAKWCHQAGKIGLIIEVDPYGKRKWENREFRILVDGTVRTYHPDDFYLIEG